MARLFPFVALLAILIGGTAAHVLHAEDKGKSVNCRIPRGLWAADNEIKGEYIILFVNDWDYSSALLQRHISGGSLLEIPAPVYSVNLTQWAPQLDELDCFQELDSKTDFQYVTSIAYAKYRDGELLDWTRPTGYSKEEFEKDLVNLVGDTSTWADKAIHWLMEILSTYRS